MLGESSRPRSAQTRSRRKALWRIHRLFEFERAWSGGPPATRKALRDQQSRPLVDAFFAWAEIQYEKVKAERGVLRSAFGYVRVVDEDDLRSYATGMAAALRVMGPFRRGAVLGMIRGLGLAETDAEDVLTFALSNEIPVADGDLLRAAPADPGDGAKAIPRRARRATDGRLRDRSRTHHVR